MNSNDLPLALDYYFTRDKPMNIEDLPLEYHPGTFSGTKPLYWSLLRELMESPMTSLVVHKGRRTITLAQEREPPQYKEESLIKKISDAMGNKPRKKAKTDLMTPNAAMLAGLAWPYLRSRPDFVQLQLYQDESFVVGPHSDFGAFFGPKPDDVRVCIFSIGAKRRLGIWRIGRSRKDFDSTKPDHVLELEDGSLLVMKGEMQRKYMHAILPEDQPTGPRISVTVAKYLKPGTPADFMLYEPDPENPMNPLPRYIGPPQACLCEWVEIARREGVQERDAHPRVLRDLHEDFDVEKFGAPDAPQLRMIDPGTLGEISSYLQACSQIMGLEDALPLGADPKKWDGWLPHEAMEGDEGQ